MELKLKEQANKYFGNSPNYQKMHQTAKQSNSLQKYYLLLVSKLLQGNLLTETIINFHKKGILHAQTLLRSIWGFTLGLRQNSCQSKNLAAFISQMNTKSIIDRNLLLTILPQSLVDSADIAKKQRLEKEARGAYTKYFYDQNKHNLFRENNEGFAKLSLMLATLNSKHNQDIVEEKILSLIGNYDLDPDRVLDLIIQAFIHTSSPQIHFSLISKFKPESISTLIGHRIIQDCNSQNSQKVVYTGNFQNFITSSPEQLYKQDGFMVHPNLIKLTVMLIKRSIISLQSIFPFLLPHDSILQRLQAQRIDFGKDKITKAFKINLEEMNQEEKKKQKQEDQRKIFGQLLYSPKLTLMAELVRQNDWQNFKILWEIYKNSLDLLIYQPLLHALYDMLQWMIQPLYQKISFSRFFKTKSKPKKTFQYLTNIKTLQIKQIQQINQNCFDQLDQIMAIISEYIGLKSELFIKICRLFRKVIKEPNLFFEDAAAAEAPEYFKQKLKRYIYNYILPGVSYQVGNQVISNQAFDLLECFEYQFRYTCYAKNYKQIMIRNPYQAYLFERTKNKQNIIVNNLSEQNKKIFVKKMAKITHNQSMQVFYWIFRRLMMEDYQAVVPQIVAVLSASNFLTLQVAVFIILHCLTQQKQPTMYFKTGQQLPWFKNITKFTSLFFRKYLDTDITPIFDFIIMKLSEPISDLQDNEQLPGSSLLLLKSLLSKMSGNFMMQDVSKTKYDIICAGQIMQSQAMYMTSEVKAARKSKIALQNFFWGSSKNDTGSLSFNLLILLAQKRAEFMHRTFIGDLKVMGDIYDNFSQSIIQLIRLLNYQASDYQKYSKLLPPNFFNLLLNQYKIPLQIAFQIYRPAVKHISFMGQQQFDQLATHIEETMKKYSQNEGKFIEGFNIEEKLKQYLCENLGKSTKIMSKTFFTTFWFLTPDSIYFPQKLYTDKIQEIKKKIQAKMPSKRNNDRDDKDLVKAKSLYQKLKNQSEQQKQKNKETMSPQKLKRFHLNFLNSFDNKGNDHIQQFAEVFVQVCLLPRILMDPYQAFYCFKFTVQMIKANALTTNLSPSTFSKYVIRLLTFIIEYVMNYLPFATERESSNCLSVFLSEILGIFSNWNDINKLKSDLNKNLQIDPEVFKEQKYQTLKKYLLTLYERVGSLIKSIKDQPFNIKNCLYLLQKIDSIPGYRQQAEDLQAHMKELKQKFTTLDMQTILQRQVTMLNTKKQLLPERIDDNKGKKAQTQNRSNSHSKNQKSRSPSKTQKTDNNVGNVSNQKNFENQKSSKNSTKVIENLQSIANLSNPKKEKKSTQQPSAIKSTIQELQQISNIKQKQESQQINAEPQKIPPIKTVAQRKMELQQSKKQIPQPTGQPGSRIPTVREMLSEREKSKKNEQASQPSHQKDLNEKFANKALNLNKIQSQIQNNNQKGEGQSQYQREKQDKNRQRIQPNIKNKQSSKYKNQDKKERIPQKKMLQLDKKMDSSIQQLEDRPIQDNKTEEVKQKQPTQVSNKNLQEDFNKQKQSKVISITIQNKSKVQAKEDDKIHQHSSYPQQIIKPQSRQQINKYSQHKDSLDLKSQNKDSRKNYKQVKYNRQRSPSNKRDNYYQDKEKQKLRQKQSDRDRQRRERNKDDRDKERSKSKDKYRYKPRDDYRQRQQDRRKDDKERSHRKQDKYEREKRHDSRGNKNRDRHYHK